MWSFNFISLTSVQQRNVSFTHLYFALVVHLKKGKILLISCIFQEIPMFSQG